MIEIDPSNERQKAESMKAISKRGNWLWGLAGSDFNLILYGLAIFRLKRVVPPKDYRDFQVIWWSFVLSLTVPVLLLSIIPDWHLGVLLAKGTVVALSIPVFLVLQTTDINGIVIQRVFEGIKTRNPLRPLFGAVLLSFGAVFLLGGVEFKSVFAAAVTLVAVNVGLLLLGFCVRNFRVAMSGE